MPKIHTYGLDATPDVNDLILGSASEGNATKNYKLSSILGLVADAGFYDPIDTDYATLKTLRDTGGLVRGAVYRFSHITEHLVVGTTAGTEKASDFKTAVPENFLVRALDEGTLDTVVVSELHPLDVIHWTPDTEGWNGYEHANSMGQVTYRKFRHYSDALTRYSDFEADFDLRYCVYVTWGTDLSTRTDFPTKTDNPLMWQQSDLTCGIDPATGSEWTWTTTGTQTVSYAFPWDLDDKVVAYSGKAATFGRYEQNVVVLTSDNEIGTYDNCFLHGDFRLMRNVRAQGTLKAENNNGYENYTQFSKGPHVTDTMIVGGYFQFNQGGLGIDCRSVHKLFYCHGDGWLSGDSFDKVSILQDNTTSYWRTVFNARAVGLVERVVFDGAADAGIFYSSIGDRAHDCYENLRGVHFKGWSAQGTGRRRTLRNIQNGYLDSLAIVEKITSNALGNNEDGTLIESTNSSIATAELTIPDTDAYCGVIPVNASIDTITREGVQTHPIRLKVTANINVNAGGNILNATGAAYVSGDFLYLVQVSATEWIVLG